MYTAVIVCGGKGKRTNLDYNKVFTLFHGVPLFMHAVNRFKEDRDCEKIVLVANKEDLLHFHSFINDRISVVTGGLSRHESVHQGLKKVSSKYVLVHDGARGYFSFDTLTRLKYHLKEYPSITPVVPVVDTLKKLKDSFIETNVSRENVVAIQTPQAFLTETLLLAHEKKSKETKAPCDASLVEETLKIKTKTCQGDRKNIKFTTIEDLDILELILK